MEDSLDAADVEQFERQRPSARGIDTGGPVALGEAEQLLGLAQPRPRKRPAEQHAHELADGGADLLGLADARVRGAHGVGRACRRVVGVVGRPPARRLGRVDLDQLAPVVDADEPGIAPDVDTLSQILVLTE